MRFVRVTYDLLVVAASPQATKLCSRIRPVPEPAYLTHLQCVLAVQAAQAATTGVMVAGARNFLRSRITKLLSSFRAFLRQLFGSAHFAKVFFATSPRTLSVLQERSRTISNAAYHSAIF